MENTTKTCTRCGTEKPLDDFYHEANGLYGRRSKCKACWKLITRNPQRQKEYRAANRDKLNEYSKAYYREHREELLQYHRELSTLDRTKQLKKIYAARTANSHREQVRARIILNNAIRDGKLTRQPCEVCGVPKTEGHHEDYSKPLEVQWLCKKHHGHAHGRSVEAA